MTRDLFGGSPVDAVLLDMDGTILTSIKAAERVWANWARRQDWTSRHSCQRFTASNQSRRCVGWVFRASTL